MRKIFVWGKVVDLKQETVTNTLVNEDKDSDGKWPDHFHLKFYKFMDTSSVYCQWWDTKLYVHKIKKSKFIEDITRERQICTYVLVYPLDENNPRGDKHCVYAKSYNPQTKQIHCINSDAHNPEPKISVDRLYNKFYQVSCVAELETQPLKQTYPKSIANIPNSNPDTRTRKATNESIKNIVRNESPDSDEDATLKEQTNEEIDVMDIEEKEEIPKTGSKLEITKIVSASIEILPTGREGGGVGKWFRSKYKQAKRMFQS